MSKAIYILKMSLVQHQIPALHWTQKKKKRLPGGVVLSNSPGLRSFERPSLLQRADSFKAVDKKTLDLIAAKIGNLDVEEFEIKMQQFRNYTSLAQGLCSTSSKYPRTFCGKRTGSCSFHACQRLICSKYFIH